VKHFIQPETKQFFRLRFSLNVSEGICSELTCSDFSAGLFESPANQTVACLLSRDTEVGPRFSKKHISSCSPSLVQAAPKSPFFAVAAWVSGSNPAHCAGAGIQ